ncbi:formate hydrogenlyase [Methanoculleus chikugoensis]|uniref:NADH-quinone oxidoreductase subunit B family protein n=1 Tax=Methanoculleus chikugoensis TaxID=118126 RepID=UPI000A659D7D|nr:formate hydrogenlyase [Methanoculleus chikugoensis]
MLPILKNIVSRRPTEEISPPCDPEVEAVGRALKRAVDARMRRSLAIRELDSGSDNATEIEINLLSSPHYDVERFGVSFVASPPRHADLLLVTGAVTRNMEVAVKKTYEAMPAPPKYVVAVGDDACDGGIYRGTYAVLGGSMPSSPPST